MMLSIELWRPGAPQFAMCAVLGVAARLTGDETRTVFARWKPFSSSAVASPARPGPVAATILATSLSRHLPTAPRMIPSYQMNADTRALTSPHGFVCRRGCHRQDRRQHQDGFKPAGAGA